MESVKIIENFKSFQGEGPDAGKSMLILRFKYCDRVENKKPCNFCDTVLKMRITNESESKLEDIQKILNDTKAGILITGGEPTYERHFEETITLLNKLTYPIANVETNGYNITELLERIEIDSSKNIKIMYSPKFFNEEEYLKVVKTTKDISNDKRVFIKVVAEDNELIRDYLYILDTLNLNSTTYLMPQGKNRDELIKNASIVFDMADEYKMNFSSREHLIYEFT